MLRSSYKYENDTVAVSQFVVVTDSEVKEYLIWNTMYDLESLTSEMEENGFVVKEKFDDICGSSYTGKADTICLIATPE